MLLSAQVCMCVCVCVFVRYLAEHLAVNADEAVGCVHAVVDVVAQRVAQVHDSLDRVL